MNLDLSALNEMLGSLLPRQPRMAYWRSKHGRKKYCYNIEPVAPRPEHGNKKWCAVIYKSNKRGWNLVKERYFRKRNSAKACAYKWYMTSEKRKQRRKQNDAMSMPMP